MWVAATFLTIDLSQPIVEIVHKRSVQWGIMAIFCIGELDTSGDFWARSRFREQNTSVTTPAN